MLRYLNITDVSKSEPASLILMSIAWGAGVGGLASPLGGAMNLVVINYIQELTGKEYMYIDWVVKFAPIMLLLLISNCIYLVCIKPKGVSLEGSKEYFIKMRRQMHKISRVEGIYLVIFLAATVLAFTRNLYAGWLANLKPAYVFIIAAVISFLIRDEKKEKILKWQHVQTKVSWSLMYIFAGGLAAGTLLTATGADACIGQWVSKLGLTGGFLTVAVIVMVTILLSDVTSNTATAAVADRIRSPSICIYSNYRSQSFLYPSDFHTKRAGRLWVKTFLYVPEGLVAHTDRYLYYECQCMVADAERMV